MSKVESIARPRRNGERRRAPTASISKESPAITGVVEMVIDDQSDQQGSQDGKGHAAYARRQFERSEERFSRNAETDLVCRLLLEKKNPHEQGSSRHPVAPRPRPRPLPGLLRGARPHRPRPR